MHHVLLSSTGFGIALAVLLLVLIVAGGLLLHHGIGPHHRDPRDGDLD